MAVKKSFPEFLIQARINAGLSQRDVARLLGYETPQFISNWERGVALPPVKVLKPLIKLFKVRADEMLDLMEDAAVEKARADLHKKFKVKNI